MTDLIASLTREAGFDLNQDQLDLLARFHALLLEHNDTFDLTTITDPRDVVIKHYIDSMMVARLMKLPKALLDLGTGPGFPGIPLKILQPELSVTLAEPRKPRVEFLTLALATLRLPGLVLYPKKITAERYPKEIQAVITRAVGSINETLRRVENLLPKGGQAIFMKGPQIDEEISAFERDRKLTRAFALTKTQAYDLPLLKHARRLLIFNRR